MVIMNSINVFAAFLVLFCLSKDCESCFSTNHYESLKIATGSSFYKECKCTEPGKGKLLWVDFNNREIPVLRPGTKSAKVHAEWRDQNTYSLFISNVSKSTSGIYKCVTKHDGEVYSLAYDIQAYDPPYFVQTKENQYLVSGEDSPITCEARGGSNLIISWHKEQSLIEPDDDKYKITPNGLTIIKATDADQGAYRCTALDPESGGVIDTDIKVEVMYMPVIEEIVTRPGTTVIEGESLVIECRANGMPHPEYSWNKITGDTEESNITWTEVTNKIIFESVNSTDQGTYECTASNIAGNVTKQVNIEVLVVPTITQFNNVTAVEGSVIQMVCKAFGRPRPNVTISYEGELYEDSIVSDVKKSELEFELVLTFLIVNRRHSGIYTCNAINQVGAVSQEEELIVLYKPHFETESETIWGWNGHKVNLSCENDSNPPAVVSWKYQGNNIPTQEQVAINDLLTDDSLIMPLVFDKDTMYGVYECTATNDYGSAKKYITVQEAFPPPAVSNVTTIDLTATSITFNVAGPENVMGPPVIGFTSEYDESENYNITNIHINRTWSYDRPLKIDKLKPNTTYQIKFAAVNNVGAGSWSEFIKFETLEKSSPEELIWESDPETAASERVLKWKAPDDNGEPIDFYVVRYCPYNSGIEEDECKEERINPTTEFRLNRMDANTTYFFEILAHNSFGNSSAANIYVTIPAENVPEPLISASGIIGLAVVIVILCLVILDVILLVWRRQGILATCCLKKNKKRIEDTMQSRDKKGLLKDNGESVASDTLKRPDREFEYKHTGIITGKHSAV